MNADGNAVAVTSMINARWVIECSIYSPVVDADGNAVAVTSTISARWVAVVNVFTRRGCRWECCGSHQYSKYQGGGRAVSMYVHTLTCAV